MIRADFHCHTRFSHDCFAPIPALLEQAKQRELTHLAITDHDAVEGALRARDQARGLEIIVGCEISLIGGAHLIGLFLERLPKSRTALEAADEIHAQGGFVYLPHPFQPVSGLFFKGIDDRLLPKVDAVEICNGFEPADRNRQALALARDRHLPMLVGSDAHYLADVGRACVVFPEHTGRLTADILKQASRRFFVPTQDLSALHTADSQFRANTAPGLRRAVPKPLRKLAKRANWLRFQRQIQKLCQEPVRQEFLP
jgi:predicted metal-dependent phosphoesterase TrpH